MNLETVLEHTSDAITELNEKWCYIHVNHSAELLLRRKRSELLGRSIWKIFPELLNTPAEEKLRYAAQTGIPVQFEQFLPGLYGWHQVRAVPIENGMLLFSRDISDRVRMLRDEAVRARIRNILQHAPIAISIMRGKEHRIEMQNEMFFKLVGGRNLEGLTARNALPELEDQGFFNLLDRVYDTGNPYEGKEVPVRYDREGKGVMYDGFFNFTYQPLFDTNGKVEGILSISIEITEQVLEQRCISRFAAERDAILQQLIEGVIVTDAGGRITFVNEAAKRLHGVAKLDVSPEQYSETYHLYKEDGTPYPFAELALTRAVLEEEIVTETRWRIRRPDGSEVLVVGNARPIYDVRGAKIAAVLTIREV